MIYERLCYMCPKCNQMHFFDNAEEFSTICPKCNVKMVCVEKKFISKEQEKKRKAELDKKFSQPSTLVYCPYCNSVNTSKITTTSKVVNTAIFGIFGTKRHNQWHCNNCKSDF